MLAWQWCGDFCDVSTLGGAQAHFDTADLLALIRYPVVLAVHNADAAGDKGRQYIASLQAQGSRVRASHPPEVNGCPAHDLTDFWRAGGDLRAWAARHVADAMEDGLSQVLASPANYMIERWRRIAIWAREQAELQ